MLDFIKIIHILAIISWMAGLLYLPRLFVYHSQVGLNKETYEIFITMEEKLYRIIMNPAMMVSWVTGLYMAYNYNYFYDIWFIVKFSSVLIMTIVHLYMKYIIIKFKNYKNNYSHKFYRILNEIPTFLMIVIVTMVILKII